uniref:Uncharacterized protein n=1 Tax=Glossina palpalis gambiensis TaxID=67801 RepID=A0A1B0B9H3_9MUSC
MITDVPNVIAANEFNYKTMTDGSYGELMCIIETSPQDTLRRPELYRRLPALTFDDNNINGRTEPNRAVEITHLRVQHANLNRSFATLRGNTNIVESIACTNIWPSSSTNINEGSSSQYQSIH